MERLYERDRLVAARIDEEHGEITAANERIDGRPIESGRAAGLPSRTRRVFAGDAKRHADGRPADDVIARYDELIDLPNFPAAPEIAADGHGLHDKATDNYLWAISRYE
jgi:hypothetical protein